MDGQVVVCGATSPCEAFSSDMPEQLLEDGTSQATEHFEGLH